MKHEYGLFIGRFQPFHDGHAEVATRALSQCNKLIIAIGSSQESRTERNPLSYTERGALIRSCYWCDGRVIIIPIPDRENPSDDSSWGEYVMKCVEKECGVRPTIIFEGSEDARSHWYDTLDVEVVSVKRNNPVSGTTIREMLIENDGSGYALNVPCGMWCFYEDLKNIMLEVRKNDKSE